MTKVLLHKSIKDGKWSANSSSFLECARKSAPVLVCCWCGCGGLAARCSSICWCPRFYAKVIGPSMTSCNLEAIEATILPNADGFGALMPGVAPGPGLAHHGHVSRCAEFSLSSRRILDRISVSGFKPITTMFGRIFYALALALLAFHFFSSMVRATGFPFQIDACS